MIGWHTLLSLKWEAWSSSETKVSCPKVVGSYISNWIVQVLALAGMCLKIANLTLFCWSTLSVTESSALIHFRFKKSILSGSSMMLTPMLVTNQRLDKLNATAKTQSDQQVNLISCDKSWRQSSSAQTTYHAILASPLPRNASILSRKSKSLYLRL